MNRENLNDFVEARVGAATDRSCDRSMAWPVAKDWKLKAWLRFNLAHRIKRKKYISLTDLRLSAKEIGDALVKELGEIFYQGFFRSRKSEFEAYQSV